VRHLVYIELDDGRNGSNAGWVGFQDERLGPPQPAPIYITAMQC
jgi:hypothetical protein